MDPNLDSLLEASNPADRSRIAGAGVQAALDDLGARISRSAPGSRGTRRRWSIDRPRLAILVAAVLLATSAAVAAHSVFSAHTGRYPAKAEVPIGGPGEELDPSAPDFRTVALQLASDIPYPRDYAAWRDFLISDEIDTDAGGTLVSTGALHGWFAASAFCAWVQSWRHALVAGDDAAAARAADMVAAAPRWQAVTAEDPHPSPTVPADQGTTYSLFGWMLPYRDAVLAGERARVDHLLATGYGDKCWTSDPAKRGEVPSGRGS